MKNSTKTMRTNHKTEKDLGFTIIEVMIVLAIVGVIMLIVFVAIPALKRSARNYARKQEATRVAAAISEFAFAHNYRLPGVNADGTDAGHTKWVPDCQEFSREVGKLNQFGDGNGDLSTWCIDNQGGAASQDQFVNDYTWHGNVSSSTPGAAWLVYTVFATCPPAGAADTITLVDAGPKQSVVLYPIDTAGNQIVGCVQAT
jgi:prepilin-type N-terminal cleavage/methylation domain-containing protein